MKEPGWRLLQKKVENVVFQTAGKLCFFSTKEVDLSLSLLKKKEISPGGEIRFFTRLVVRVVRAC